MSSMPLPAEIWIEPLTLILWLALFTSTRPWISRPMIGMNCGSRLFTNPDHCLLLPRRFQLWSVTRMITHLNLTKLWSRSTSLKSCILRLKLPKCMLSILIQAITERSSINWLMTMMACLLLMKNQVWLGALNNWTERNLTDIHWNLWQLIKDCQSNFPAQLPFF